MSSRNGDRKGTQRVLRAFSQLLAYLRMVTLLVPPWAG